MDTTPSDWPTQLMLPGQAAAPAGPIDLSTMYVFHHAFRRDLDAFVRAVRLTPVSDRDAWTRLADRWALFARQLHHHHEAEDAVLWPWMHERVEADEQSVLDAMAAEHEAIDPGLTHANQAFNALAGHEDEDVRAALEVRLVGLRAVLDQHLAHEERDAMAILQRVSTQAEWEQLEKQLGSGRPSKEVLEMVPWAVYGIEPALLRRLLSEAPMPMRLLARLLGPRFARREVRLFGVAHTL